MTAPITSYQPSGHFYRLEIREARTKKALEEIAFAMALELEKHKEWIREKGMVPPKFYVTPSERRAKSWGSVSYLPSTAPESGKGV